MDKSLVNRLIRFALLKNAENTGDYEALAIYHQNYWSSQGKEYFSSELGQNVLEDFFLPKCSFVFDLLEKKLNHSTDIYNTLIEIGTGDGSVLEHLSTRFPQINRFIGIDLSIPQIHDNKEKYSDNKRLEFVASDGFDWIEENGYSNTIIVTSRGVLEYFTQDRLTHFFDKLNNIGQILFIAIEPTGVDHDFSKNPNSQVYSFEGSFSHNYARIFEESGFELWHQSKILQYKDVYFNFFGAKC
ncbi:hypothetical protein GCM10023315_24660 [Algibacter aquimarinus]|uniref:Methyltransferase domain-containing protein n=2 Tax=Algibacter aquimarinus TaxID=1136748 RepID=A0ABP9HLJ8_9FLAO